MTRATLKAGEGFKLEQILSQDGFTLDTTDFVDTIGESEENEKQCVQLSKDEIVRLLNLEIDEDIRDTENDDPTPFIGISFETLKSKMTSIYGEGEVLKLVKREGVGSAIPSDAQVTVEYVGYFEYHDEPFDSTYYHRDKRSVLRLGKGEIISGLEIAISSMKKHEKALFIIQPSLAYGPLGCLPRIPPNSEVLFKVELIDFLDNGSAEMYDELSNEDKKKFLVVEKIARDLMMTARDNFQRNKVKQAMREYNRSIQYLERASLQNDEEETAANKLLSRGLTNLMICYNKIGKPKLSCAAFQRLPTKSGKAYFQHGKALVQLGEYDEAMSSLQKAKSFEPNNEDIRKEIQSVEKFRQKYLNFSKRFAQNSLRLTNQEKNDEFEEVARDMCTSFINDETLVKQQIPQGLSEKEQECIRRVAASLGLSITKQARLGTETLYLTKKSYYNKDSYYN